MIAPIFHAVSQGLLRITGAFMFAAGVIGFKPGEYNAHVKPKQLSDVSRD